MARLFKVLPIALCILWGFLLEIKGTCIDSTALQSAEFSFLLGAL
jgi:hypothetical protein